MPTTRPSSKYARQTSFGAGEISPAAYGRTDIPRYAQGMADMVNWIITDQGGMRTRPGTHFVTNTESDTRTRLIPFSFNRDQTYILAFSNFSMMVIKDGGVVLDNAGEPYKIATNYSSAQLQDIRYVQSLDVIVLCHPDHHPKELARLDHDEWVLANIDFTIESKPPVSLTVTATGTGTKEYRYVVTTVDELSLEESAQSSDTGVPNAPELSGAAYNTLTWPAVTGARRYRVYRLSGGVYSFIGFASSTTFVDDGIQPDIYSSPPVDFNPFTDGNYPRAVSFYQQRLVFGGSNPQPQTLWLSRAGEIFNFSYSDVGSASDSMEVTLASRKADSIQHLLPSRTLLAFTRSSEWEISHSGAGLSLETIDMRPQTYRGSGYVEPLVVGHEVMFVQDKGDTVRAAAYSWEEDTYTTSDLSVLAEHLIRGQEIGGWTYAQTPNSTVWAFTAAGKLLSLVYVAESELVGWAQHETEGTVESIASVSEGEEDIVYLVVNRVINGQTRRFIERMGGTLWSDPCEAITLDASLQYEGAPVTSLFGLDHLIGHQVSVVGDCGYMGLTYVDETGSITLSQAVAKASVGLPYQCRWKTLPVGVSGRSDVTNRASRPFEVTIRLRRTRTMKIGSNYSDLSDVRERMPTDQYGEMSALLDGIYEQRLLSPYDHNGQVCGVVDTPHPAEVLMVGTDASYGR